MIAEEKEEYIMASFNDALEELIRDADGSLVALLGDSESGMLLASAGSGLDVDVAAAGATEFMRAKLRAARALGLQDSIEDILVTLESQYLIIRPLSSKPDVFIYLALERSKANLALARMLTKTADSKITL